MSNLNQENVFLTAPNPARLGPNPSEIDIPKIVVTDLTVGTVNGQTINGAIVMTAGAQTLSDKTLASPIINTPTITGGTVSSATISSPNITGASISGSSISGGTISSAAINTPTITGGTISGTTISAVVSAPGDIVTSSNGSQLSPHHIGTQGQYLRVGTAADKLAWTNGRAAQSIFNDYSVGADINLLTTGALIATSSQFSFSMTGKFILHTEISLRSGSIHTFAVHYYIQEVGGFAIWGGYLYGRSVDNVNYSRWCKTFYADASGQVNAGTQYQLVVVGYVDSDTTMQFSGGSDVINGITVPYSTLNVVLDEVD